MGGMAVPEASPRCRSESADSPPQRFARRLFGRGADLSDHTYYAILGIPESSSLDEVKRAYRNLIRQVHPDSVPNASSYWRHASEEKSKELNEAYRVLADPQRRSRYDEVLARDRGRRAPRSSNWNAEDDFTPQHVSNIRPVGSAPREGSRRQRLTWQLLKRWAIAHQFLTGCIVVIMLVPVVGLLTGLRHGRTAADASDPFASGGFYSALPCLDPHATVSPIDGKPCPKLATTAPTPDQPVTTPPDRLTTPRWFYVTSKGAHSLGGVPDEDTCKRFNAKSSSACDASLRFCPEGTLSKRCVSFSKWKKSNVDPPRVEKSIPGWPSE
jgi:hypothetical protein